MIFDYADPSVFIDEVLKCNFEVLEPKVNKLRVSKVNTETYTVTMRKIEGVPVTDPTNFETPKNIKLLELEPDELENGEPVHFEINVKNQLRLRFFDRQANPVMDVSFL